MIRWVSARDRSSPVSGFESPLAVVVDQLLEICKLSATRKQWTMRAERKVLEPHVAQLISIVYEQSGSNIKRSKKSQLVVKFFDPVG